MQCHSQDQLHRKRALDPQTSYIVRAAAGSGKTSLLIQRFLKLLAQVAEPEQIVAITFTKKAAAEMRQRIIVALERAYSGEEPKDGQDRQIYLLAKASVAQDQRQNWKLQDNPSRLNIQTIDALCARIICQAPVLSRCGSQLQIMQQTEVFYLLAAERSLMALEKTQSWTPTLIRLLQYLDNDLPRLRKLLADMLANRDQWLRHISSGKISRSALTRAFQNLVTVSLAKAISDIDSMGETDQLVQLLQHAAENLAGSDSPIVHCADLRSLPTDVQSLQCWEGIITLLFTKTDKWRKTVPIEIGFTKNDCMKTRMRKLLKKFSGNHALLQHLINIRDLAKIYAVSDLHDDWISEQHWQIIVALSKLLVITDAQLRTIFSEYGQIDFIGKQQAAFQALSHEQQPTELAFKLDYQFQHLLIDEFQDISISQCDLIEALIEGWSQGDGRSLFFVGDPMQSIYRFREAEVSLFLKIYQQQHFGQVMLYPLTLSCNFRSQSNLVNWVNLVFSSILPQQADIAFGAVDYSHVTTADSTLDVDVGLVAIHPLLQKNTQSSKDIYQQEAQQVGQLSKNLHKNFAQDSIAILATSRTQLSSIIQHLQQINIPCQSVEMQRLEDCYAVQDCLILTRGLLYLADRIAWLSILRAPWCGLILADMYKLVSDQPRAIVWELMQNQDILQTLSQHGQQQLAKLNNIFSKALANRQRVSLRRLVEMVWIELGGPATLRDPIDLQNVQTYFSLLQNHEHAGDISDFAVFNKAVEKLYGAVKTPRTNTDQVIQIMTIHKAKGLEFDHVIVAGLGRTGRSATAKLLIWQEQQQQDGVYELLVAPIKSSTEKEPLYSYLNKLEKRKNQYEQDRLLYVATTRARKQLHLFGATKLKDNKIQSPKAGSLLEKLWPVVSADYESILANLAIPAKQPKSESQKNKHQPCFRRHDSQWCLPVPPADVLWQKSSVIPIPKEAIEYKWASNNIRLIGIVVHQQLQQLAEQPKLPDLSYIQARKNLYAQALKQQGISHGDLVMTSQHVVTALSNTINDPRGQWLLLKHQEAKNEYALTGLGWENGEILNIRIDRTFIDQQGIRWIIDYKLSDHQGTDINQFLDQQQQRYRRQLEKYAWLMRLCEDRPIKLGLYFPFLQGWRAWDYIKET
ncbi:ATP-dependent DNA helicase pcrA [uncultured Candidatus Thioglobus sp.]|nr:ATP-dependent DNA helicase pcrA [uncultured Candidatus Thioglobus sp.]